MGGDRGGSMAAAAPSIEEAATGSGAAGAVVARGGRSCELRGRRQRRQGRRRRGRLGRRRRGRLGRRHRRWWIISRCSEMRKRVARCGTREVSLFFFFSFSISVAGRFLRRGGIHP
jgi:hypothetical protein